MKESKQQTAPMDLVEHIAVARDLRRISQLLEELLILYGRPGIRSKGPYKKLKACFFGIDNVRMKACGLYRQQYGLEVPDIYFKKDNE